MKDNAVDGDDDVVMRLQVRGGITQHLDYETGMIDGGLRRLN